MTSVKTEKGTILPLMSLKGKPYMMVAHRIVWFNEEVSNYSIETEYLERTEERATVKAIVSIFDKEGKLLKKAPGTKSEARKDFPDFIEKAETGAVGRAITMLGFGTAYAIADLDEGDRIIDSPVTDTRSSKPMQQAVATSANQAKSEINTSLQNGVTKPTFKRPTSKPAVGSAPLAANGASSDSDWS